MVFRRMAHFADPTKLYKCSPHFRVTVFKDMPNVFSKLVKIGRLMQIGKLPGLSHRC